MTTPTTSPTNIGHITRARGSSLVGATTAVSSARGPLVTATPPAFDLSLHPFEMSPPERAAAVAALLAAGLLRHLRPAAFPPPAGTTNSQEKSGEST